jgi:Uma2 family endonuclease
MAQAIEAAELTVADLTDKFGPIPAYRIRNEPRPGQATEQDVIELSLREDRLYELVDGVLIEKMMGFYESCLGIRIGKLLSNFVDDHDLGVVAGADGTVRLAPGLVRIPDVAFVSWERLPQNEIPSDPIADVAPDLAVEVLSAGNTKKEMARKLEDYFAAGVRLVWFVDPKTASVQCYTSPTALTLVKSPESLDGGEVLPGFVLPLDQLFKRKK